jgi:hypothetical protein
VKDLTDVVVEARQQILSFLPFWPALMLRDIILYQRPNLIPGNTIGPTASKVRGANV